jgi:type IV pilus assembly protein PilB
MLTIDDLIKQSQSSAQKTTTPSVLKPKEPKEPKVSEEATTVSQAFSEKMENIELGDLERRTKEEAEELGMEYINLKGFPVGPEVLGLITEEEAKEKKMLCFFRLENEIRLATCDSTIDQTETIARLQRQYPGSHIVLYLTSIHSFTLAMALYKNIAKVKKIITDIIITEKEIKKHQEELHNYGEFNQRITQVNLTEAFAMIIAMSLKVGSSDIHIEAEEKDVAIRFRVDGMLQTAAKIPAVIWPRLISRIKTIAGLKINISDVPQDGRITINFTNDKMDIRVSTLPTAFGESVVMRLLKSSSVGLGFEQLGLTPAAFKKLEQEISKPDGMIITTGPTGSGKTTTLYAILNTLNKPDRKIITLENPVEYKLAGIDQSQIDHSKGYTFSKGLRAILRQDPNIVMVGEIRDLETAETAIQAALTGHLMLSTIHTNDAAGAIPRFLSMGVAPFLLAPALRAVIGQRLVRKICEHCKMETTLPLETMERVKKIITNIPANSGEKIPDVNNLKFYKGNGCEICSHTGYKGRIGIYEIFTMNAEIEAITLSGQVSEYQMRDITHKNGMASMVQDGILKAVAGITSVDEVFRVASED